MAPISVDENIQRIEKGIQEFMEKIKELREETNDKQEELDQKFQEYQMEYENNKRSCDDAMNEGIQEYQSEMFRLEGCLITFKGFKKAGITEIVPPNETCQKPEPEPECKQPTHKEWVKHFHHMK
jgi:uncharacterized membrane protein (DUF106 family)